MMAPAIVATERRAEPQYLRCDCCATPVAEVREGVLIIRSRHHAGTHTTIITLRQIVELLERAA